ncbi:unnamed protein product [Nezara viridula]|uniref:Fibrinogen C-terminal domain-containing protein n=1 Tax=Nezara viridula TaxID=85310 RepID=A0A9P0E4M1_NEZVI|nr:unnamed protein product [Nezara viridula]
MFPLDMEQYLFNVFEVIVSTLETKLQRIENLDRAVEHLMRRVEQLDSRMNDNIDKTESIITNLRALDSKLPKSASSNLDMRLVALDQKVSDIDTKLIVLKNQLDNNFLPSDDINAEASEKKPVTTLDVSKVITSELEALRGSTTNLDRKLQFHINVVSESLGKVLNMMTDIHEAVVEPVVVQNMQPQPFRNRTTTPPTTIIKNSKLDKLVRQMHPMLSVSNKMDEVWNVVVGTKVSVDDLVPKSDELLTQTQRQERAISDIHADLRANTNKIIANLGMVEKRLKKQEEEVVTLRQPEPLLDPTIERLVEYEQNRYTEQNRFTEDSTEPVTFTTPPGSTQPPSSAQPPANGRVGNRDRSRGLIFPSVKNKPAPANTSSTFVTDQQIVPIKDVKGYSCTDLMSAGMRQSGVYYLQIRGTTYWFLKVFCEQEISDGGWTVIQRRDDVGEPRENFNRDWSDYKNGFGDPAKEFWLGNENIYMLTNNEEHMLRVELEDFEGNKRYAQYSHFKIYSEGEYYKLEIDGYEGNAGDSLNDPWYGSNNSPFSTYNRDNDRSSLNCASMLKGGWWWKSCGRGLNGLYLTDPQDITARQGIVWFRWRGWDYTLKKAMMMIRPKSSISQS